MRLSILDSEYFNAADYFVDRNIREQRGNKPAVICQDRQLTYGEVGLEVNRFGNALHSAGIKIEDRVAMLMLDTEFFPFVFFGSISTFGFKNY